MALWLVGLALLDGTVGYDGLFADFEALMDRRVEYMEWTMHGMDTAISCYMLVYSITRQIRADITQYQTCCLCFTTYNLTPAKLNLL